MAAFIIFLACTLPITAVLAIAAIITDVILPAFPKMESWINNFLKPR